MALPTKGSMEQKLTQGTHMAIGELIRLAQLGNAQLWVDYDKGADVLYVSFEPPQKADDAYQGKDGIIRRVKKKKIVGLTILNASRFKKTNSRPTQTS